MRLIAALTIVLLLPVLGGSQTVPSSPSDQDSQDVVTGVCLHAENPNFPLKVAKEKARGEIVLRATITSEGNVKDATVVSGESILTEPAIEAVRKWRYVPSVRDGHAVESHSIIKVPYDLRKGVSRPEDATSDVPREPQENVIQEIERGELFWLLCHCVTVPKIVHRVAPEYSEAAIKTKFEGDVELGVVVGADGEPRSIWVVRTLGRGLDEKMIEAVRQWRFEPAMKDGKPVAVVVNIVERFRVK